jgi:hypothetical protein
VDLLDPATQAAAAAWGPPGVDTGQKVHFGEPANNSDADTKGHVEANKEATAMVAKTTTTIRPGVSGVDLQAAIAHEGTHVLQWYKWAASWDLSKSTTTYDLSRNLHVFDAEHEAYQVTNEVYTRNQINRSISGCKGCVLGVGNKTVGDVDAAIRRILRDPAAGYNVTPGSPGVRMDLMWK